jgi:hypothetical protein
VAEDVYVWRGSRPAGGWHVHGWLKVRRYVLIGLVRRKITLLKRRWRRSDRPATVHSRPPDDLGLLHDALILALELWCWLDVALGLHRYDSPIRNAPSRRTVQRWLRRATPRAPAFQSAVRFELIERCEPRPLEILFPGGLSPPGPFARRRWRSPPEVSALWRGFYLLFGGAHGLDLLAARLLAGARGRLADPTSQLLL